MRGMKKVSKAIIPVAGLGTRFLPITKAVPKEMIPIIDRPMIQYIVDEALDAGLKEIVLVTARNKEAIENYFDHNYELEDTMTRRNKSELAKASSDLAERCNLISVRQKNPMGLGHAVLTAAPIVGEEPFAVLLGDDIIRGEKPCIGQLLKIYEEHGKSVVGVMEVPKEEVSKYGIVEGTPITSRLVQASRVVEKPKSDQVKSQLAIPGRYVLSSSVFQFLREIRPGAGGEIQLTDGLQRLAETEGLLAYLFEGRRFDTGDRLGYLEATLAFGLERKDLRDSLRSLIKKYSGE